ncbi:ATP-dependent RNA helicase [Microbotryomycetes sp. JL201]|nr:ATP-dependent RNA helicase [Microbotryomycetes sp. JL201]
MAGPGNNKQFAAARARKRKLKEQRQELPGAGELSQAATCARPPKKKTARPLSKLKWSRVALPSTEIGFSEDGGMLELEEVDGVDVVYGDAGVTFEASGVTQDSSSSDDDGDDRNETGKGASKRPKLNVVDEQDAIDWNSFKTEEELMEQEQGATDLAEAHEQEAQIEQDGPGQDEEAVEVLEQPVTLQQDDRLKGKSFSKHLQVPAAWSDLPLAKPLYAALAELGFDQPTKIQQRVLRVEKGSTSDGDKIAGSLHADETTTDQDPEPVPSTSAEPYVSPFADEDLAAFESSSGERDIVGVAQTGSGKTLAYGLPILSWILDQPEPADNVKRQPAALVLAPTRELALQVRAAMADVAYRTNPPLQGEPVPTRQAAGKRQRGRFINVVALTGGMSIEKQKRQLSKGADVIVATPGRLWDLIGDDDELAKSIKGIKFLVIDEADRMIENGHFAELDNIVKLTKRQNNTVEDEFKNDFVVGSSAQAELIDARPDMRTFVFSATMSKDLQRNLKKQHRRPKAGETGDKMSSLDDLLLKLDFRDDDPQVIDLSPEGAIVETLQECKVECLTADKDAHLYHFLLRYPGRTIVFLSAIDGIRRLHPLLTLLGLNVQQLHSGMQQRARLKALDRFKAADNGVLLATDVAARGLDIPSVHHVVHFQLPRSADTYVHRSGRTARAGERGLALQIVSPEEKQTQRLLMAQLGRSQQQQGRSDKKRHDIVELSVDFGVLDQLKTRLELAKRIELAEHRAAKDAHEKNWLKKTAEAMDIDIEPGMMSDDDEVGMENDQSGKASRKRKRGGVGNEADRSNDSSTSSTKKSRKAQQYQLKVMKEELKQLLRQPVRVRGISSKYLTTRNRVGFVDQLIRGTSHSAILGLETSTALEDLATKSSKGRT